MRLPNYTASTASTGTYTSEVYTLSGYVGGRFYLAVSATSGTAPTATFKIQTLDEASDTFLDVPGAQAATLSGVASTTLTVYPGIAETSNLSVSDVLGDAIRYIITVAGSPSDTATFTIGGEVFK